jgi:hypothetical protein
MAGVIDKHGQWEHCNHCGKMVLIQTLRYGTSPKWPEYGGVDLCEKCWNELHNKHVPAEAKANAPADVARWM